MPPPLTRFATFCPIVSTQRVPGPVKFPMPPHVGGVAIAWITSAARPFVDES